MTEIQLRRGVAAQWTQNNPVLGAGEPGLETDTYKLKIGDGSTPWSSLAYFGGSFSLPSSVVSASPTGGIPAWAASTAYGLNTLVTNGGQTYICNTAHTSGSTFGAESADWQAIGGSSSVGGLLVVSAVTSNGTLVAGKLTPCDASSGNQSQALPTGAAAGTQIEAQKVDSSTNTVTLTGNIRDNAAASLVIRLQFEAIMLIADGTGSWWPAGDHKTLSSLDARYDAAGLAATALAEAETFATTAIATEAALLAPISNPTFSGTTTAPEFSASGLTGATAASRYVGGTVSGAPVSGTFAKGDHIVDQTAQIWVCTTAGTPGTWGAAGAVGTGPNPLDGAYHMTGYGVKANVQTLTGAVMASGSPNLADTTNTPFANAVAGMPVVVCNAGGNTAGQHLYTTIASVTNSGHVVLNASCANSSGVSGVVYSFGTDDTTAAQACITACPKGGTVILPTTPFGITTALSIPHGMNVVGPGVGTPGAGGVATSGFGSLCGPTVAPYLSGSVCVVLAASINAFAASSSIEPGYCLNFTNVGVLFAGLFTSTGHGFYCPAPTAAIGHDNGIMDSHWANLYVFGHDGSHYGGYQQNPLNNVITQLLTWGGGTLELDGSSVDTTYVSAGQYGNVVQVNCFGIGYSSGTAHGFYNNTVQLVTMVRPQFFVAGKGSFASALLTPYFNAGFDPTGVTQNTYRSVSVTAPIYHVSPDYEVGTAFFTTGDVLSAGGYVDYSNFNKVFRVYALSTASALDGALAVSFSDGTTYGTLGAVTLATRPSPFQYGAGSQLFESETNRPIWSDTTTVVGGDWRYGDNTVAFVAGTPGGAGTAPGSVAGGPLSWWGASYLSSPTDGQAISSLTDQGSGGNAMAQATGSAQPVYKAGLINGLGALRFNGTSDYMQSTFTLAQPATIIVVYRLIGYGLTYLGGTAGQFNDTVFDGVAANAYLNFYNPNGSLAINAGGNVTFATTPAVASDIWHIATVQFNGSSSLFRWDGAQKATGNAGSNGPGGITLGVQRTLPGAFCRMDLAECVVFNTALSSGNMLAVERWLATKYALTSA